MSILYHKLMYANVLCTSVEATFNCGQTRISLWKWWVELQGGLPPPGWTRTTAAPVTGANDAANDLRPNLKWSRFDFLNAENACKMFRFNSQAWMGGYVRPM